MFRFLHYIFKIYFYFKIHVLAAPVALLRGSATRYAKFQNGRRSFKACFLSVAESKHSIHHVDQLSSEIFEICMKTKLFHL